MASVSVRRAGEAETYEVTVEEAGGSTTHTVTMSEGDYERLSREGESEEAFVERCFEFLLEREPKESILRSFDVTAIGRYFPEFENEIGG